MSPGRTSGSPLLALLPHAWPERSAYLLRPRWHIELKGPLFSTTLYGEYFFLIRSFYTVKKGVFQYAEFQSLDSMQSRAKRSLVPMPLCQDLPRLPLPSRHPL